MRHKDADINLPVSVNNVRTWESIYTGILMDLRDELKELNRTQAEVLRVLKRMDRRMARRNP